MNKSKRRVVAAVSRTIRDMVAEQTGEVKVVVQAVENPNVFIQLKYGDQVGNGWAKWSSEDRDAVAALKTQRPRLERAWQKAVFAYWGALEGSVSEAFWDKASDLLAVALIDTAKEIKELDWDAQRGLALATERAVNDLARNIVDTAWSYDLKASK